MDYIKLTPDTIDKEHICCAISVDKDPQVISKKQWLREHMEEGLVFLKAEKAKNAMVAWTNYALFYNGRYITNEILSEKKFITIYESLKGE